MTDQPTDRPSVGASCVPDAIKVQLRIGNRLLREALVRLFGKAKDFIVLDSNSALDSADSARLAPSRTLFIADTFDPDRSGNLSSTDRSGVETKTVLIGMSDDPNQFLAAVRAGVAGYLLNDASAADIIAAARAPFHGEVYCPPRLCQELFHYIARQEPRPLGRHGNPGLTLRQERLIALVAEGLTNKEIASALNLSEFTVRNHIHRILRKLHAGSRSEAVNAIRLSKRHLAARSHDPRLAAEINEYKKGLGEPKSSISRKAYQHAGAA
jgi:DNA-binding NarL/FixJ family response regulator